MDRLLLIAAALNGLVAVAAGAFGAHGLRNRLGPDLLHAWQTGSQYQLLHAVALVAVGLVLVTGGQGPGLAWLRAAGWGWLLGMLLFSGSLYLLALGGPRWLGPVTPLGGLSLLLGWAALAVAAVQMGRLGAGAGGAG